MIIDKSIYNPENNKGCGEDINPKEVEKLKLQM